MTTAEIKQTLQEKGKFEFQISQKETILLFHNKGRYSYKIKGIEVGITEKQLGELLSRLPSNVRDINTN